MSVKDLINAIASGSAVETEQAFNQVMAEKISARLDDMRVDVAQNMFQTEAVEETLDESYGDSLHQKAKKHLENGDKLAYHNTMVKYHEHMADLKSGSGTQAAETKKHEQKAREHKDSADDIKYGVNEELTLEDYSAEEIEDFMQTEDYEQLDELSKKTLGDYVKKASQSLSHSSGISKSAISPAGRKFHSAITTKRKYGISKAVDKLTK